MSTHRATQLPAPHRDPPDWWPDTTPMPLEPESLAPAPIDGLDVNEIDSETVFDRLFGNLPMPKSFRR